MVVGGNFLHGLDLGGQLAVWRVEEHLRVRRRFRWVRGKARGRGRGHVWLWLFDRSGLVQMLTEQQPTEQCP